MTTEVVLLSVAAAIAAGLNRQLCSHAGMSLAADPLSHVRYLDLVLPGTGIAEPLFGAVAALLLGAFLVWRCRARLERHGGDHWVVFSAALAIGSF